MTVGRDRYRERGAQEDAMFEGVVGGLEHLQTFKCMHEAHPRVTEETRHGSRKGAEEIGGRGRRGREMGHHEVRRGTERRHKWRGSTDD